MQSLEEAEKELIKAIDNLLPELNMKYQKVYNCGSSITCYEGRSFKQFRVTEDYERRNIKIPINSAEYQAEGGYRSLAKKIGQKDLGAWKIEIKGCYESGQNYEGGSQKGGNKIFLATDFEKMIKSEFLR